MCQERSDDVTKILIMPTSKEMVEDLLPYYDGIILGIEGLSVNLPFYIKLEELKNYQKIKESGKALFIMLNKNMHNSDLDPLKETLQELKQYQIDGVFYYDVSLINLKQKLNLSYPFIWSQEHFSTNAETCNFWASHGCEGAYLSSEITVEEIKEIRTNTNISLFVTLFGYLPMFDSKRHLVKNYLKNFHLKENGNQYFIEKEGKKYPIIDDENGTTVYSWAILNAISEYFLFQKIGIDYVILNSFAIDDSLFKKILMNVYGMTEETKDMVEEIINELPNVFKGFLYTETIYKVKGE